MRDTDTLILEEKYIQTTSNWGYTGNWGKKLPYNEITIGLQGVYNDYDEFDMEVMTHVDENANILRAYTYLRDVPANFPKKWMGKISKNNPLFVYLTKSFVTTFIDEISAQISENLERDDENKDINT